MNLILLKWEVHDFNVKLKKKTMLKSVFKLSSKKKTHRILGPTIILLQLENFPFKM